MEKTALETPKITHEHINDLIEKHLKDIDDPKPKHLPQGVTIKELEENIQRWKELRDTGCKHMQEVIAYIQHHGDSPWYFRGILDGIQEIVDGGHTYDAEGKINPGRAQELRKTFRSSQTNK